MYRGCFCALALLACALLAGCITLPSSVESELDPPRANEYSAYRARETLPPAKTTPVKPRVFDASSLPLASGQIVVVDDGTGLDFFMGLFSEPFMPWTHSGIVVIEDGVPMLYDMHISLFAVPGVPPTVTTSGHLRRIPLKDHMAKVKVAGFYDPPPHVDRQALINYVKRAHALGVSFDTYFDGEDSSKLYCAELMALALEAAGGRVRKAPARANASHRRVRDWLRIRANWFYMPTLLLEGAREAALWSPDLNRTQIDALFEIRHELARRFDDRARLGHVVRWVGDALIYRPEVWRFITDTQTALADFKGNRDALREEIRRRALAYFQ